MVCKMHVLVNYIISISHGMRIVNFALLFNVHMTILLSSYVANI